MLKRFIEQANKGEAVFITDVRNSFCGLAENKRQVLSCVLNLVDGEQRLFELSVPALKGLKKEELDFVNSYLWAEVYNILSALGGLNMTIYINKSDKDIAALAETLNKTFAIDKSKAERYGYAKCVSVIDRMLDALVGAGSKFEFIIKDISEKPAIKPAAVSASSGVEIFKKAAKNLEKKCFCGMDIGGTDIKVAIAVDGKLAGLKEYDWFPESFKLAKQMNEPICLIIKLVRAKASVDLDKKLSADNKLALQEKIKKAMHKEASFEFMGQVVSEAERVLENSLIAIDGIGLSFPDVVIKDKIVGGEATKTRGMRENSQIDYEQEFKKITDLDKQLLAICRKGGVVKNTNDGPMAAFTAAVEIAASDGAENVKNGVFAHTLGTELGTGWVTNGGQIPEIPLECYNFIIDLGDFVAKSYPADDARSINNVNTHLAGTLQKYASQSGVFRLGLKLFKKNRPDLYQELFDKGFVAQRGDMLAVPTKPKDMRKGFLEHMMGLIERENDETVKEIFRQVGVFLAITWFETQRILQPQTEGRTLFGRLVKKKECFELIKAGASGRQDNVQMDVADSSIANTSLMKQLEADPEFTVAQFAQAIGSIYYANMGLPGKK
jgi:hypothetical protein